MKTLSKLSALAFACLSLLCLSCTKPEEEEEPDKIVIPEAVDLGLSVKWASFDIGATKPGEPGYFFSWGETAPKDAFYNWSNYAWSNNSPRSLTKYNYNPAYGSNIDYRVALKPEDDAAHVLLGEGWHVPTREDIQELIDSPLLTQSIEKVGLIDCLKLTSIKTGKSIMFPAAGNCDGTKFPVNSENYAGYFWTAEIEYTENRFLYDVYNPSRAYCLMVSPHVRTPSLNNMSLPTSDRAFGMNIRAVYSK